MMESITKKYIIFSTLLLFIEAKENNNSLYYPKGYECFDSKGDLNNDSAIDIILTCEDIKKQKQKLMIFELNKQGVYTSTLDSNTILSYPKHNGNGYMVQGIYAHIDKGNLTIDVSIYSGKNYLDKYIFKKIGKEYLLIKIHSIVYANCDNSLILKEYLTNVSKFDILLQNFSIDYFYDKYNLEYQKIKNRVIPYNIKKTYTYLQNKFNKKLALSLIIKHNNESQPCNNNEYLSRYLFLKNNYDLRFSNNIAYYLQKAGANKEAIYLLEKILEKFPKRTVAYYNLADAYWELGNKKKAINAYTTYVEQMRDKGKQKKIPQIILDRVKDK